MSTNTRSRSQPRNFSWGVISRQDDGTVLIRETTPTRNAARQQSRRLNQSRTDDLRFSPVRLRIERA